MALKPKRNHKPALTEEQVLQIRKAYYQENDSYRTLAEEYGVTKRVVEKAVKGIGRFYSGIQDDIPESTKITRVPAREKYSLRELKREYVSAKKIKLITGKKAYVPKYNAANDWTLEQKERFRESERIAQERAKEFGF